MKAAGTQGRKVDALRRLKNRVREIQSVASDGEACITTLDDDGLMQRVLQDDQRAYRLLVERHIARTVALAKRILSDQALAEDAAQDVFLNVWRNRHRWQPGRAAFSTWLYRITVNKCLDYKRKGSFEDIEQVAEPMDTQPDAVARIHTHQVAERLRDALAQLSEQQQVAMALYYQQGLSAAECADVMDMGRNAVESLLKRARKRIREIMRSKAPDTGDGVVIEELSLYGAQASNEGRD